VLLRLFGSKGLCPNKAEVISADSMQVYRGMDIGTAKPVCDVLEQLPHHLINIRNPDEQFNVGDFVRYAYNTIAGIAERGKIPVVAGGTGFYLKNLILGLPQAPPSDAAIRAGLKLEFKEKGADALWEELAQKDPESAQKIHRNDAYRLLRALEVFRLCGCPLSAFKVSGTAPHAVQETPAFQFRVIGLFRPREELYWRINERCTAMFAAGLPDEVRRLYNLGYTPSNPGLRAIGYREFFVQDAEAESTEGKFLLSHDMEGVKELIAQNSRRYAKRQITYFNSLPYVKRILACSNEDETALHLWEGWGSED